MCSSFKTEHQEEIDLFTYFQRKKRPSLCSFTKMKCSTYSASFSVIVNSFVSSRVNYLSHCQIRALIWNFSKNSILAPVKRSCGGHCSYFFIDQVNLLVYYLSIQTVGAFSINVKGGQLPCPSRDWAAQYCHWSDGISQVYTTLETRPTTPLHLP